MDCLDSVCMCVLGREVQCASGMTAWASVWCDGVTLPQHELVACNGSSTGARENLTHILHQAQAVLCVQSEAVWELPLLDTGRALSYSFKYTGCETFLADPKTSMNVSEELSQWGDCFQMMKGFFLTGGQWRRTYQVSPHCGRVPLCIDSPQEAQQQGVAHPLGPVVAAVALPAAVARNKTCSCYLMLKLSRLIWSILFLR